MTRKISIDYLSRVEGEGGITVDIRDGTIASVHLNIFEAPRFFEAFLRGRPYTDVPDFTARICGICPIAYQMSSVHALEKIFGVSVSPGVRDLRRLLYCGEWIASHALHAYLLQGPDFYGLESAWANREYREIMVRGLSFKAIGDRIVRVLGGRPVHPVTPRVGGFSRLPAPDDLRPLLPELERLYTVAIGEIGWAARLAADGERRDVESVSLRHPDEYPMSEGVVFSDRGLDEPMERFFDLVQEYQQPYSTALHSGIKRESSVNPYLVGPLSRLNNNADRLPGRIRDAMAGAGVTVPLRHIQAAMVARIIEMTYAIGEAARVIRGYKEAETAAVPVEPKAGEAVWITEAPRGILIHRYETDDHGRVQCCTLIPPTSQNLAMIEEDVALFVRRHIDKPADFIKRGCEQVIRSYDPCISCATHITILRR